MESAAPAVHTLRFTGEGSTYFGIWIVNLVLTILTVGLYSPWAKVRRLRYLYGNTLLDGSPFEYHGSPIALLKGRLIGLALLVAYTQSVKISLALWLAVVTLIGIALPWLLWKSLRFRLANSSYRGIHFAFDGSLRGAYATFVLPIIAFTAPALIGLLAGTSLRPGQAPNASLVAPLLALPVLGLAIGPWLYFRVKRYQQANARLGDASFAFDGVLSGAYGLAFAALGLFVAAAIAGLLAGFASGYVLGWIARSLGPVLPSVGAPASGRAAAAADQIIAIGGGSAVGYLILLSVFPIMTALAQNFVWGKTRLAGRQFLSRAGGFALWRINAVNAILLIFTVGLYWPFALMRLLRYRLSTVSWTGDPGAILVRAGAAAVGATGQETADLFGFDLAL